MKENRFSIWSSVVIWMMLITSYSCNKENAPDCFQKAGKTETERRSLALFESIEIRDYLFVELYDSSEYFIEVTAPRNLIPEVVTNVEENELIIRNDNSCNWVRSYDRNIVVRIYAPEFGPIENYGTGGISSIRTITQHKLVIDNRHSAGTIDLTIDVDSVAIRSHTGVADVLLKGHAGTSEFFAQGYGWIDGRNLHTTQAYVNNSSINNVYVNASDYLFGVLYYSGSIYYSGDPDFVESDIQGSGEMVPF